MQESGIKSFIFSFVLALCAVVAIDKALLHAPKNDEPVKNISYKNIALFSDKQDEITVASATVSSNKIAEMAEKVKQEQIPEASQTEFDYGSAQDVAEETVVQNNVQDIDEKNIAFVYNPEKEISENELFSDELSFAEIVAQNEIPAAEEALSFADIDLENTKELSASDEDKEKLDIQIADTSFDENINLWLPIEKGAMDIDIIKEAHVPQVAMAEQDVMLSSVLEEEKANTEPLSDAIVVAKTADPSDYTDPAQEEDSPWVVAKGAKFTKNRKPVALAKTPEEENLAKTPEKEDKQALEPENVINFEKESADNIETYQDEFVETLNSSAKKEIVSEKILLSEEENYYEQGFNEEETFAGNEETFDVDEVSEKEIAEEIKEEKPKFSLNVLPNDEEVKAVSGILTRYPKEKPDGSVDVAYKVMQNILIPVPEDILEDDNLVPQLEEVDDPDAQKSKKESGKKSKKAKEKSGILKSISSFFSGGDKKKENKDEYDEYDVQAEDELDEESDDDEKDSIKEQKKNKKRKAKEILPTEMKLSFQPEKAEISGTTLRWLKAFAESAKDNPNTYIEIRIDGSGAFALQQKRLNLLQGVLSDNGLDDSKINIVFTSREPNSFIIRSLKTTKIEVKETKKKENKTYYQTW